MQVPVKRLLELGPWLAPETAEEAWLQSFESALRAVQRPVSDTEARALATLFGPGDCFGLGWPLLHLIETAPGWPLADVLSRPTNEWIERLNTGVRNAESLRRDL